MSGTVRIGVIAPHGDLAIEEACAEGERALATQTHRAMQEMARRVAGAAPDVAVVATPHNVHVEAHMAVLASSTVAGRFDEAANQLPLSLRVDRDLALAVHRSMNDAGIPTVAVSFGGNVAAESSSPIDWGTLVPMWHIANEAPDLPVVVVAPARDLDPASHVLAGATIVRAARVLGKTVAFVASADQGHGHMADGPYGFHAESAAFDAKAVDIVRRGALAELTAIPVEEARAALVDSWWQMLMLHGALEEDGGVFEAEFLAYEAPTYYGMLTATFRPRG